MGLVLGVEGDGSHSHAALADASGTLMGLGANDDSSDWDDVGIAAAAAALRSCVTEAADAAHLETTAGAGRASDARVGARLGAPRDGNRIGARTNGIGATVPTVTRSEKEEPTHACHHR